MDTETYIDKVAARLDVDRETAQTSTRATLVTVAQRLQEGQARDLSAQLPRPAADWVEEGANQQETFDADGFIARVAELSGLEEGQVPDHARAVLGTLSEAVTAGEIEKLIGELPTDIARMVAARG